MIYRYPLTIKEFHLDSYGHVNNATYLALLEEARGEAITERGYGYDKVHESGRGPVILEANLKFSKELTLREKVVITMELVSYEGRIMKLRQHIFKENGEMACEALITAAFFDLAQRKIIMPDEAWKKAVGISSP